MGATKWYAEDPKIHDANASFFICTPLAVLWLSHREELDEAEAAYCHFRSIYLQIRFVRLRNTGNLKEINTVLDEEIELAQRLHAVMLCDSRIGFEASNHYYYTANDLKEKILNCEHMKTLYFKCEIV